MYVEKNVARSSPKKAAILDRHFAMITESSSVDASISFPVVGPKRLLNSSAHNCFLFIRESTKRAFPQIIQGREQTKSGTVNNLSIAVYIKRAYFAALYLILLRYLSR